MALAIIDPNTPFQPQYQPAIDACIGALRVGLGANLHSLYLYGSVARKTAKPHHSNLDLVIVTHRAFEDKKATIVNTLRWRFKKSFPFITDLSIQTALKHEVASLESLFSWGFLLKHCAVCIDGNDLSECFGVYEPSWEIAKYWNMDVGDWVSDYREKIARANTDTSQCHAQQMIAKKLLRASYSLVMYRDKQWLDDPIACGQQFLTYFPERQTDIERLMILLKPVVIPKRSVIGLLDKFGPWLVKQYEKTEFRIG